MKEQLEALLKKWEAEYKKLERQRQKAFFDGLKSLMREYEGRKSELEKCIRELKAIIETPAQ